MEWCGVLPTRQLVQHLYRVATTSEHGSGIAKLNLSDRVYI